MKKEERNMNKYKLFIYLLYIIALINICDMIYTLYLINAWNQLGYNGINMELNPLSRFIMQNYSIYTWIAIKCIISISIILFAKAKFLPKWFQSSNETA